MTFRTSFHLDTPSHVLVKVIRAYSGISDILTSEDWRKIAPDSKDLKEADKRLLEEFHHDDPPHGLSAFKNEVIKRLKGFGLEKDQGLA